MQRRFSIAGLLAAAVSLGAPSAQADSYPVSGKWTYENAGADGPSRNCASDRRTMDFQGQRRFDRGGGVPDYRNLSAEDKGSSEYRMVDEFYNGQTRGRINYTLKRSDPDHLEMTTAQGKTIRLRRCE